MSLPVTAPITAPGSSARPFTLSPRPRLWPALFALFLTIAGARLWLVENYGSALPFWDQWDAEGQTLIKPWLEGRLRLADLFAPHLEHRIFLTRVFALALFQLNGQWDAQLEMAANALFFAGLLTVIAATLQRGLAPAGWIVLAGCALLFTLPYDWENTLGGFQSQFYFLLGCSLLALWGLGTRPAFSRGWWAGAAGAVLACFSMGSGVLAAAVALGWNGLRMLRERRRPSAKEWGGLLFCLGVVALGWALRVEVPGHAPLRAASFQGWLLALGRCLAWPWFRVPAAAWLMSQPLGVLTVVYLRRSPTALSKPPPVAEWLLLVGGWVLLQAAAIAYARGATAGLSPRYMDLLAIAALINGVAAWLLVRLARRPVARTAALSLAILWSGAELAGLGVLGREAFTVWLPAKLDSSRAEEENVRAFLVSDRPEELLDKPPMTVPFPDARSLIGWLRDPTLRRTLPAVVRDPLRLEHAETTGAFTLNALPPALRERDARLHPIPPAWGSFGPLGGGDQGQLKAGLQAPGEGERAVLPYLRVQFAGDLGRAGESGQGLALRIESATAGDRPVTSVLRPARVPGERWRTEYLRTPGDGRKGLRLSVEDRSAESWLALRAPVEVGALSYWAGWLLRHSEPVFWAGALGLAAYGSARTFREWRESAKISREPRAATLPAAP